MAKLRGIENLEKTTTGQQLLRVDGSNNTILSFSGTVINFEKAGVGALLQIVNPNILQFTANAGTDYIIGADSTDSADNRTLTLSSNNTALVTRGAFVRVGGNESSTNAGDVDIEAGNVAGGNVTIKTHNATSNIYFYTQNIYRWSFDSSGNLISATSLLNIGSVGTPIATLYATSVLSTNVGSASVPVTNTYSTNVGTSSVPVTNLFATNIGSSGVPVTSLFAVNIGNAGAMDVTTTTASSLFLGTNNTRRWLINATGALVPNLAGTYDIGTSSAHVSTIYVDNIVGSLSGGSLSTLANDTFLNGRNFANSADVGLIKIDTNDDTILNSASGKVIKLSNAAGTGYVGKFDYADQSLTLTATAGSSRIIQVAATIDSRWTNNPTLSRTVIGTVSSHDLYFTTANLNRWFIDTVGRLAQDATNGNDLSFNKTDANIVYNSSSGGFGIGTSTNAWILFKTASNIKWSITDTGAFIQDATNGSDIIFSKTTGTIRQVTADGSDTGYVMITGGGAGVLNDATRGGQVIAFGNENATDAGGVRIVAGGSGSASITGSTNQFWITGGSHKITQSTNNLFFDTSSTIQIIRMNTSSGTDNKAIGIYGGGSTTSSRGAYVEVYGTNHATSPGVVNIQGGGNASSNINLTVGNAQASINLTIGTTGGQIRLTNGTSRAWYLNATNAEWQWASAGGDGFIGTDSGSGSDNRSLALSAGGGGAGTAATLPTRTGSLILSGNQATSGGNVLLQGGNVSTGHVDLRTNNASTNIRININGTIKWLFNSGGALTPNANNNVNFGTTTLHTQNVYTYAVGSGDATSVNLIVGNATKWTVRTDNAFAPATDVTGDLGTSSLRVRKLYVDKIDTNDIVDNEFPGGTIDGINTVYTLAFSCISTSLKIYYNGLRLAPGAGNDYTVTGAAQFTLNFAPQTGDVLLVDYRKS